MLLLTPYSLSAATPSSESEEETNLQYCVACGHSLLRDEVEDAPLESLCRLCGYPGRLPPERYVHCYVPRKLFPPVASTDSEHSEQAAENLAREQGPQAQAALDFAGEQRPQGPAHQGATYTVDEPRNDPMAQGSPQICSVCGYPPPSSRKRNIPCKRCGYMGLVNEPQLQRPIPQPVEHPEQCLRCCFQRETQALGYKPPPSTKTAAPHFQPNQQSTPKSKSRQRKQVGGRGLQMSHMSSIGAPTEQFKPLQQCLHCCFRQESREPDYQQYAPEVRGGQQQSQASDYQQYASELRGGLLPPFVTERNRISPTSHPLLDSLEPEGRMELFSVDKKSGKTVRWNLQRSDVGCVDGYQMQPLSSAQAVQSSAHQQPLNPPALSQAPAYLQPGAAARMQFTRQLEVPGLTQRMGNNLAVNMQPISSSRAVHPMASAQQQVLNPPEPAQAPAFLQPAAAAGMQFPRQLEVPGLTQRMGNNLAVNMQPISSAQAVHSMESAQQQPHSPPVPGQVPVFLQPAAAARMQVPQQPEVTGLTQHMGNNLAVNMQPISSAQAVHPMASAQQQLLSPPVPAQAPAFLHPAAAAGMQPRQQPEVPGLTQPRPMNEIPAVVVRLPGESELAGHGVQQPVPEVAAATGNLQISQPQASRNETPESLYVSSLRRLLEEEEDFHGPRYSTGQIAHMVREDRKEMNKNMGGVSRSGVANYLHLRNLQAQPSQAASQQPLPEVNPVSGIVVQNPAAAEENIPNQEVAEAQSHRSSETSGLESVSVQTSQESGSQSSSTTHDSQRSSSNREPDSLEPAITEEEAGGGGAGGGGTGRLDLIVDDRGTRWVSSRVGTPGANIQTPAPAPAQAVQPVGSIQRHFLNLPEPTQAPAFLKVGIQVPQQPEGAGMTKISSNDTYAVVKSPLSPHQSTSPSAATGSKLLRPDAELGLPQRMDESPSAFVRTPGEPELSEEQPFLTSQPLATSTLLSQHIRIPREPELSQQQPFLTSQPLATSTPLYQRVQIPGEPELSQQQPVLTEQPLAASRPLPRGRQLAADAVRMFQDEPYNPTARGSIDVSGKEEQPVGRESVLQSMNVLQSVIDSYLQKTSEGTGAVAPQQPQPMYVPVIQRPEAMKGSASPPTRSQAAALVRQPQLSDTSRSENVSTQTDDQSGNQASASSNDSQESSEPSPKKVRTQRSPGYDRDAAAKRTFSLPTRVGKYSSSSESNNNETSPPKRTRKSK